MGDFFLKKLSLKRRGSFLDGNEEEIFYFQQYEVMTEVMERDEFELRYHAFSGFNSRLFLDFDEETLIHLVATSGRGKLEKSVPETSPDELKAFTSMTYSPFKKSFLDEKKEIFPSQDPRFSLSDYIERLEYELKVIKEMGFNSYFLVVSDYIRWAKNSQIMVGPGRGSGAGSLLAWLIGITDIDPLPFDLLFERFLNPARISMPDFDVDFEDTLRDKVISYVTEKYHPENVCSIGTFMKMASKAAFKDAARTLGIPFDKSNLISNLMVDNAPILTLVHSEEGNDELKSIYQGDEKVQKAAEYGSGLEGNMRQLGVHACGIIIAPEKVTNFTPTQYNKETDHTIVSQYDGPTLENIGLLKMDFLGLRNLSIIKNCIKIIEKRSEARGEPLEEMFSFFLKTMSFNPPLDDQFTYDQVFKAGDTTGIFQFESAGMRKFLVQLEPNVFDDLVAMAALYRPGPMEFIPRYIERKHGREAIDYMYPDLKTELLRKYGQDIVDDEARKLTEDLNPIMNMTYGIAVYQEQLMFLVQSMAGFSLGEADMLRRGVGKKKKEVIEKIKGEFVERAASYKNYKPETSRAIYEKMIEPAASYSFNKSHAVCYAMIAYQTAYLKAHHSVAFSAALIRSVEEDVDTQSFYISEIQQKGIQVLHPDVNASFAHVAAIDETIRLGFLGIKGVGSDVGEFIQQERRKGGNYSSLEDFLKRCQSVVNKKSLEGLVKAGALDCFEDRKILMDNMAQLIDWAKNSNQSEMGLFGGDPLSMKISLKQTGKSGLMYRLMLEQEVFKAFVSGNPLDGLYPYIKKFTFLSLVKEKSNIGNFTVIGYVKDVQRAKKKGFFIKIEDISDTWEFFVKDPAGLEKFDIVIIHGFKKERIYLNKIVKTSHDRLVQLAGSKFDPSFTVAKAKELRYGEKREADIEKLKNATLENEKKSISQSSQMVTENFEDLSEEVSEDIGDVLPEENGTLDEQEHFEEDQISFGDGDEEEISLQEDENDVSDENDLFLENGKKVISTLPESIEKIQKIIQILRGKPGDKEIEVLGKTWMTDEEGICLIENILK